LKKIAKLPRFAFIHGIGRRLAAAALCLAVAGCVSSSEPILGEAKAILGERFQLHVFAPPKEGARTAARYAFQWNGSQYVAGRPGAAGGHEFTVHPFEGRDLVVQWKGADPWSLARKLAMRQVHYYLARKIAEGGYLLLPITDEAVDEGTRNRFCTKSPETVCRISTPEQLFVFARATAEREEQDAGIAVVVPLLRRGNKR
jgi:hypothetical protein